MPQGHFPEQMPSLAPGTKSRFSRSSLLLLIAELLLAVLLGWLVRRLWGGGMVWLLAGMMAGAIVFYVCRSLYPISVQPHVTARKIGQALVGMAIGFSISWVNCYWGLRLVNIGATNPGWDIASWFLPAGQP
jgi:hypothetical protein